MKRFVIFIALLGATHVISAQNQPPVVQNIQTAIDNPDELTIQYDLADNENDPVEITFRVSVDNGKTYAINTSGATGDVGFPVTPGNGKTIVWNYNDLNLSSGNYQIMLVADDLFQIDIQEIVDEVDSNRLRADLEFIEGVRHRTVGAAHLQAVKDSIDSHFANHNLENENMTWLWNGYQADNFVGRKKGLIDENTVYIIDGHFDTEINSPGADDNGSAVASVMEALRVLAPYHFKKTIKFIGFDLEEEGLIGSIHFNQNGGISDEETIEGVFNFEMIGYYDNTPGSQMFPTGFNFLFPEAYNAVEADDFRGNFITNVGIHFAPELIEAYENAAMEYVPELRVISLAAPSSWQLLAPDLGRSDHAPFWLNFIPALMLTDGANFRNPYYHSPADTIGTLNFTFMSNVVKATVAAVAELAEVQHSTFATAEVDIIVKNRELFPCDFSVFPNPNNQWLQISFSNCSTGTINLKLLDSNGVSVYETSVSGGQQEFQFPTNEFAPGVYFLKLQSTEGFATRKVTIIR